jgi:hypothetical protein
MARDYEDIFHLDDLDDDELRRLVRETLRDNRSIDPHDIHIHVRDSKVILSGRVGTDAERRIAQRVVEDRIGIENVESQLLVDPLRRVESPEAIDEHLADEEARETLLLGDHNDQENDEARHLGNCMERSIDPNRSNEASRGFPRIRRLPKGGMAPVRPTTQGVTRTDESKNVAGCVATAYSAAFFEGFSA